MILCIGTTPVLQRNMIFPRLVIDEVNRATETVEYASGKSINVARVLHALGEEVVATGFLGGDSGAFIRAELAACGVANDFVTVIPKTRMCVTLIDQQQRHITELVEEARQVESHVWDELRDKITQDHPRATLMVLSGSLPPGAPPEFYAWCIARGVMTILDAAGEPLRRAFPAKPFIVKPNRAELSKTLDIPIESDAVLRDAIRHIIALGPAWAVVTEGKAGAIVSDGKSFWRVRSPQVDAVNPIGSGDSLAAGLAAALVRGQTMPDAMKLAVACGAANAMTDRAGHVRANDVARLLERVEIETF